jgi:mitogen-activated protein kinase kinase 1
MHRDIKPDNVLCNSQGFVKLTDFGITKQFDTEEQFSGTFVGTMNYMSPERMEGEKYNFEGDIWSLGLVIYELCTGFYPYKDHGSNFLEMLEQVKYQPSPSLDKNVFSPELVDFVDKCLVKDYQVRPSALALLAHPFILTHS